MYNLPNNTYGSSSSSAVRQISLFFSFVFGFVHGKKQVANIIAEFPKDTSDKKNSTPSSQA
jgi:hypothetical protein